MYKKLKIKLLIIFSLFLIQSKTFPQYNGNNFSLSLSASYTTTAKLFLHPNSPDIGIRNQFIPFQDILSYSSQLRYRISEPVILGLRVEYVSKSVSGRNLQNPFYIVDDGFKVIPVELTVYYFLPFSTGDFKFYMGGGFGIYIGEQTRKFGDVEISNVKRDFAFGLQVETGMDYMIWNFLSAKFEMRFRDPEFEVKSKYDNEIVHYKGRTIKVSNEPFDSKVNINGITFTLGLVYQFDI